jgi:uncharacterized membrane protein
MDFLLSIVTFFLFIVTIALALAVLRLKRQSTDLETRLAALTRRVYQLESGAIPGAPEAPVPIPQPPPLLPESRSEPIPAAQAETSKPRQDWEEVVGGSWLSRVGALILVIGVALFLGYSLTQLGPAGKVSIGFAVGFSMLLAGITLRGNERYGVFATSLIGGGWAAVYFTAYAAHALPPAQVIASPTAGAFFLFLVSLGMVVHALWYESERGAALAFTFSFVSLNVSPLTGFSVYAVLLLTLSILALAYSRHWFRLAVTGVILAYATFVIRGDAPDQLARWGLWVQWLAFEAFDLLDIRRRGLKRGIERSVFLLNACGFIGASLLYRWDHVGPFLFVSAAAYVVSTFIRARFPAEDVDAGTRVLGGGFEGALAAAATLMAAALIERFSGTNITLALLLEGEMIVLAGHALANRFVRGLGGAVLSVAFLHMTCVDAMTSGPIRKWTPVALLMAAVFAGNRLKGGWAYTAGAGILLAMVTGAELRREWVPFAWASIGLVALFVALRRNWTDVRLQHPIWMSITFVAGAIATTYGSRAVLPIALTVVVFYLCELLLKHAAAWEGLERFAGPFNSVLGTILLTILLFQEVQGRLLTVALGIEGAGLLVAGMIVSERVMRLSGLVLFLLCIDKAFLYDLRQLDTFSRIVSFIVLGLLLLGASWVYTRFRERIRKLL